jgi:trimethylamine:corrinoid methyltransferase-like protein
MLTENTIASLHGGEHSRPLIANRLGYEKWRSLGRMSTESSAATKIREILDRHPPREIAADMESALWKILNQNR